MEQLTVRWHGHACFPLTCRDFTVVLDPYEDHYVPGLSPAALDRGPGAVLPPAQRPQRSGDCHPRTGRPNPFRITKIPPSTTRKGAGCGGRTPSICWRGQMGKLRVAHFGDLGSRCPGRPSSY